MPNSINLTLVLAFFAYSTLHASPYNTEIELTARNIRTPSNTSVHDTRLTWYWDDLGIEAESSFTPLDEIPFLNRTSSAVLEFSKGDSANSWTGYIPLHGYSGSVSSSEYRRIGGSFSWKPEASPSVWRLEFNRQERDFERRDYSLPRVFDHSTLQMVLTEAPFDPSNLNFISNARFHSNEVSLGYEQYLERTLSVGFDLSVEDSALNRPAPEWFRQGYRFHYSTNRNAESEIVSGRLSVQKLLSLSDRFYLKLSMTGVYSSNREECFSDSEAYGEVREYDEKSIIVNSAFYFNKRTSLSLSYEASKFDVVWGAGLSRYFGENIYIRFSGEHLSARSKEDDGTFQRHYGIRALESLSIATGIRF